MDLATGSLGALLPKLAKLLNEEYNLHKTVKGGIKFLMTELESMQAALEKVSGVPADQLDKNVKLWARDVREMSYDIEDSVDTFLVRVEGKKTTRPHSIKGFIDRTLNSLAKFKTRHKIADDIEGIKNLVIAAKERRDRYNIDHIAVKAATRSVDPRLAAMFKKATELVGIEEARDELIKMLSKGEDIFKNELKVVSIVGLGGLGKTTLAKIVYDKLQVEFKCWAFVSVGQDPDVKKVLKDILLELDKQQFENIHNTTRDEIQLINTLHKFLDKKRYFVVIDDIWDIECWEAIKLALDENNCGSRIVITTRKFEVAKEAGDVYKLQPLSYSNSKKLFYTRIFGGEGEYSANQKDQVLDKILKKCGGVPLAINTMASLLAGKPMVEWFEVYSSIGFSHRVNRHAENTMRILSFSYYDMPSHLRTCLLYLNVLPEDYIIDKDLLIWKWIAEGFIHEEQGAGLFEIGERYFNELMNRSMIQPVEDKVNGIIVGCRLHDMVFSLIRSLSCDENFVTILDDVNDTLARRSVRRLSHQNKAIDDNPQDQMVFANVRSFVASWCYIFEMVPLPAFHVLRVLALEECQFFIADHHLSHLGGLVHLRYLGLNGTPISELPKEISALKFLQTLTLDRTGIEQLPLSIGMLTQLVCLHGDSKMKAPTNGILRKLTSLEELRMYSGNAYYDNKESNEFMTELRNLQQLRALCIYIDKMDEGLEEALLESLCSLPKLRQLRISGGESIGQALRWKAPFSFHALNLQHLLLAEFLFSSYPMWINCSLLPNLSSLSLDVETMDYRDMRILGRLPQLCCLHLWTTSAFVVYGGDGYFQKLRSCRLSTGVTVMFGTDKSRGPVMTNVKEIQFHVNVRCSKDVCVHHGQDISFLPLVIGLHNLPSVDKISIIMHVENATLGEVDELEAALRNAAHSHSNHPTLEVQRLNEAGMITSNEDLQLPSLNCRDVIDYHVHVRELNDIGYAYSFVHLVNLPMLEKVIACINCEDASTVEVDEAVAAMRHAVDIHPNHPILIVEMYGEDKMKVSSDQNDPMADDDVDTE